MDLAVRPVAEGELDAFADAAVAPFLRLGNTGFAAHWSRHLEPGRAWVAADGDRFVATCCTYTDTLTLPGAPGEPGDDRPPCPLVPLAGVSAVGVLPTHRRRGLLTQMMAAMLGDARRRDEALAALIATEGTIYGRYGFGVGATAQSVSIDPRRSAFAVPSPPLEVRLVDAEEAGKLLPELFERFRFQRAAQPGRSPARWAEICEDPPERRRGASALYVGVAERGYVTWRAKDAQVQVSDLFAETAEIEAALWRLVLDIDLVDEVVGRRPVDDPLRWRLADPRALKVTAERDVLWVRVLDVCAALEARSYAGEGRLVLDVAPPVGAPPDLATDPVIGRYVLDAGPDGAACQPARPGEPTDLAVDLDALGSLLLGGVRPEVLAGAGRVREQRGGMIPVADRLFTTGVAPFSGTGF